MNQVFSLRAECESDTENLKRLVLLACGSAEVTVVPDSEGLPDQEIEIHSDIGYEALLGLIRGIPDGHVMLQTLREGPLSENSLERDYDRQ